MAAFHKDPQNIIALGVTLISVCALVVSITQTRVMLKQNELMNTQARASVRPIVLVEQYRSFNPETRDITGYSIHVVNSGVGPATIEEVFVRLGDQDVASWGELGAAVGLPDSLPSYVTSAQLNQTVLQVGEDRPVLSLTKNLSFAEFVNRNTHELKITILYRSLYGDRYRLVYEDRRNTYEPFDPRKHATVGVSFRD